MNGGLQSSFTARKREEKKTQRKKSCLRNSIQPRLRRRGNFLENPPLGEADGEETTRQGTTLKGFHSYHTQKKLFPSSPRWYQTHGPLSFQHAGDVRSAPIKNRHRDRARVTEKAPLRDVKSVSIRFICVWLRSYSVCQD